MVEVIEAGDVVRHKPSGEEWVVWGVDSLGGYLAPMGWPNTLVRLADCEFVENGATRFPNTPITKDELCTRAKVWGRRFDDDRADDARMDNEWAL